MNTENESSGDGIRFLKNAGLAVAAVMFSNLVYAQASWDGVVSSAKKEGAVYFYTAHPTASADRIVGGFRKMYPDIRIEVVRAASGALMTKIDQERASGVDGGDVVVSTEIGWFSDRSKEGRLLKPAGPAMHNWLVSYLINGTAVVGGIEPWVIPYNKTMVGGNPPKTYADLLRPEFKGRLGISDLAATATVAWYDWLEKGQGSGYLEKLKAHGGKMYFSLVPLTQALASGEIAAGIIGTPAATKPLMDAGAPVDYVVPNPALGFQYGMAALAWSKRPNAALVLLDYLMSAEGQTVWHGRGESASPLPGIQGSLAPASITAWNPAAYPPNVVSQYRERWTKILK